MPLPEVRLNEDFAASAARFERWWTCAPTDRPVIAVDVQLQRPVSRPEKSHASLVERWTDVDWQLEFRRDVLRAKPWIADALPVMMPNLGPALLCVLFGAELTFDEGTSWADACIDDPDTQYAALTAKDFCWDHPLWQAMEAMTRRAVELAGDEFLPGITDLHGAYDTAAGLRHCEELCVDLLECPEVVQPLAMRAAEAFNQAFERLYAIVRAAGFGSTSWIPFYHDGPAYISNCDFWCLVSGDMADQYIVPTTRHELQVQDRSIYHLDGPDALRHLDRVLAEPGVQAVQWVYGAGNGPATRWLETFRKILDAGKGIFFMAAEPWEILEAAPALGSRGVFYQLWDTFESVDTAREFVAEVARRAGSSAGVEV